MRAEVQYKHATSLRVSLVPKSDAVSNIESMSNSEITNQPSELGGGRSWRKGISVLVTKLLNLDTSSERVNGRNVRRTTTLRIIQHACRGASRVRSGGIDGRRMRGAKGLASPLGDLCDGAFTPAENELGFFEIENLELDQAAAAFNSGLRLESVS